jgi:AcrR family transcriptional regulator
MSDTDGPLDGRTARALRTHESIVDACISLVEDGDLRPTAPRIAERAGVSVRSVFQHFDDLEGLYAAVAERLVARVSVLVATVDPAADRESRIADFTLQRTRLLEAITPVRRAANVHAPFSHEVTSRLQAGHDFLRSEVERVFAAELADLEPAARTIRLDALDVTLSWPTWESLRALGGRSIEEARAVLTQMVEATLEH